MKKHNNVLNFYRYMKPYKFVYLVSKRKIKTRGARSQSRTSKIAKV